MQVANDRDQSAMGSVVANVRSARIVVNTAGDFELLWPASEPWRGRIAADGIEVREGGLAPAVVRRRDSGLVLLAQDGRELGCSTDALGFDRRLGLRFVLMEDGRLFRIEPLGATTSGLCLRAWDVPGAYLTAVPTEEGFRLNVTVAGACLSVFEPVALLFAAEVLMLHQPLPEVDPS